MELAFDMSWLGDAPWWAKLAVGLLLWVVVPGVRDIAAWVTGRRKRELTEVQQLFAKIKELTVELTEAHVQNARLEGKVERLEQKIDALTEALARYTDVPPEVLAPDT